jgi:hypothetical protein
MTAVSLIVPAQNAVTKLFTLICVQKGEVVENTYTFEAVGLTSLPVEHFTLLGGTAAL